MKLRAHGLSASMDYVGRSMKAQMKEANRELTHFTLIVGENELTNGTLILRNMVKSEEVTLSTKEVLRAILAHKKGPK